jgi:hypothetical protein
MTLPSAKIVTFCSFNYADVLALWAEQSLSNIQGQIAVVCLDEKTKDVAARWPDITPVTVSHAFLDPSDRQTFWIKRLETLFSLQTGSDLLIHSDLDAFWLKPAVAELAKLDFDFVFSIDYALPNEIVKKWGFILCCGFFGFRPSPRTALFEAVWKREVARYFDDQIAVNVALDSLDMRWSDVGILGHTGRRGTVVIEGQPVNFLALPWELFPRQHPMMMSPSAIVAHPFWERRFHKSFVETYSFIQLRNGTLPPMTFPEYPKGSPWRPRDWAFLHILEDLSRRTALSDAQTHHLAVLSHRFGRDAQALVLLSSLAAKGGKDAFFDIDYIEVCQALGRRDLTHAAYLAGIRDAQSLHVLRRLVSLALRDKDFAAAFRGLLKVALKLRPGAVLKRTLTTKARNTLVFLRRQRRPV